MDLSDENLRRQMDLSDDWKILSTECLDEKTVLVVARNPKTKEAIIKTISLNKWKWVIPTMWNLCILFWFLLLYALFA